MAKGYSIFDKLPKSTLGLAETILSPAAAALSPMSMTNTQTEATGIGVDVAPEVAKDFPIMTPFGGYGPEGFERPPVLGKSGRYLSSEPALTMDPSKVEIEYGDPFLGAQAITKRRRIIENPELLTPIISVKDVNLAETDLMDATYVTNKRGERFEFVDYLTEDTLESRQKLIDNIQGTDLGYVIQGKTRTIEDRISIPYMTAVYDEKYEKVLENIDKKFVGIPFINDEAKSTWMLNMGYDEDTNRAIFAKQFDDFLVNQGVKSQRTRAGIILHSVNLPHIDGMGFGDPSKLSGIGTEALKFLTVVAPTYIIGEAFGAVSEGLEVGNYNLSDSSDREKWMSTFIPNMPSLIQDRYTQLNLDVPYHVAESIARRFSGAGTQFVSTAIEVAGPTKMASTRKLFAGKKEMKYFGDFEARYRKKFPDADPGEVIVAFERMRKNNINIGVGKYSIPVDLTKAKDIKLLGFAPLNIPAKVFAYANGIRTSSRLKNGMDLTDAAQAASNRIEVRNMSQYYSSLHDQRRAVIGRAKAAKRDLKPAEAQRLEDINRKIEITKADLRKTVVRSETPKFIRESNVQDAYVIIGAATANQAFEFYGGDPMLGDLLGAAGGIGYGLVKSGNEAKKLLKKFDIENVTDKQLNIADLVLNNMKNFDPEFQEALRTRVKYFNGLKNELVAVGVDPEVLDRSASRILGLGLLQTLEEGIALDLNGPQIAGFSAQTAALHKNLLTQQKFVGELRTVMKNLAAMEGVDIEGNAVKKLYDTVDAAVKYADGTIGQLTDDLEVIGRSYETSVLGMIRGSDEIYNHLEEGSVTELSNALESLTKQNISRIDQGDIVKIRDEVERTNTSVLEAISDKSKQIARILPTQGDVNKQVNKVLPDGTIIRPGGKPVKTREMQNAGDALAALVEQSNVKARELASTPFRQLDNAIFRTADGSVVMGEATTDAGPVLDSMFDVLGTAEGTTFLLEMSGKTLSRSASSKMFAFLDQAAGAFILDVAQRTGRDAKEIVDDALTAARKANDPDTIKLLNDRRIPQDLLVAQLIRKDMQLRGEDIGVLPVSFLQAKEMSDALNQIAFKTKDSKAQMRVENVANIAEGILDSFEVQLETGQRVQVGQLFIALDPSDQVTRVDKVLPDGTKLSSTQTVLTEGKKLWTEYKRRYYDDENVGKWLGWKASDARTPVGVTTDYPLGMDYGKNAPRNWLNFDEIAEMNSGNKANITQSLYEALGTPDINGNYRIAVNSAEGQAARVVLEAHAREWLTQTVLDKKPINFNDFRRKMNSLQDTFVGFTDNGTEVKLLDMDRVMTDVFPEFGKGSVDPEYFELGVQKLKSFARKEKARVVKQAEKIKQGLNESRQFLKRYSQGELDSSNVGTVLISGGVGRVDELKKHLKSLGQNEEETNEILKSLLVQEINRKAFIPTGRYTIDPSDSKVMNPDVDLDIESLKQFMGFTDPNTAQVVREIIGDKAYDTYRSIVNFTANETASSAGRTNISGIPRKFSVESYISRFYAVNRGVVSFRYVGTEAVLQQMRQNNMSLLTVALTDPKIGSLLMEMIETGKPLPNQKDQQLFELLVIATERFDNWRETSKDPIKVTSDYGHEFIYNPGMNYFGLSP